MEHKNNFVGVSLMKEPHEEDILKSKVHKTGTLLKIARVVNKTDDTIQFFAQAATRFHLIRENKRKDIPHWQVQ